MGWVTEAFSSGDWGTLVAYLILPILLMVSQFVMQKWMTPPTPTGDDNPTAGFTKQLTYMMTFMFGFFTLQVPAGLTLYWVTSNLLQMLQQWAITNDRFGLSKPSPKLAVAVATASSATKTPAALPESTTRANNDADIPADPEGRAEKATDARRRRAKRR